MSIKDDMIEQHLIDTNTCFVCRKTMNENGECDVCNDPSTYEVETVDLIELILSKDGSLSDFPLTVSLFLFWLQVYLIQIFDYQLDDFQEIPSKEFYPKYENLEHHIISLKNGVVKDDLEHHIEYLFTVSSNDVIINADVNGALNILRKVIGDFKFDPVQVCSTPKTLNVLK